MDEVLYQLFGNIFETVQYIEWNIAVITCKYKNDNVEKLFDNMQNMTLGQIVKIAESINWFNDTDIEELKYILEKRNYLAHQFFKKNDIVKHSSNHAFINNKIGELENILNRFKCFNSVLVDFIKTL